jgi:hypothetical protein
VILRSSAKSELGIKSLVSTEYLNEIISETIATLLTNVLMRFNSLPYDIFGVNKEILTLLRRPINVQKCHYEALVWDYNI